MAADNSSGRSPWLVTLLVAIITAAGAIAVAWISSQDNGSTPLTRSSDAEVTSTAPAPSAENDTSGEPVTPDQNDASGAQATTAPNIEGDYYLDPGNPRIIVLESIGLDEYSIMEQLPARWPFSGTVEWKGDGRFDGMATFDSGTTIRVTLDRLPDRTLRTSFDFITDDFGGLIDRIDKHLLVPVN